MTSASEKNQIRTKKQLSVKRERVIKIIYMRFFLFLQIYGKMLFFSKKLHDKNISILQTSQFFESGWLGLRPVLVRLG